MLGAVARAAPWLAQTNDARFMSEVALIQQDQTPLGFTQLARDMHFY
eukprot:gene10488-10556_t